jgi:BASS family bile acid:Na+ symporter
MQIFFMAVFPVLLGMLVRAKNTASIARNQRGIKRLAIVMLVLHIVVVIYVNIDAVGNTFQQNMLPAFLLFMVSFIAGYGSAWLMKLDRSSCFTIAIEVCIQNIVLAVLIANVSLNRPEFGVFAVTQAFIALSLIVPMIMLWRRFNKT